MSSLSSRCLRAGALAAAAIFGLAFAGAAPAEASGGYKGGSGGSSEPKVVATGLDNPRQLSFTRSGQLLIAEAGEGGSGPCFAGPEGETCFGLTGAVTMLTPHGRQFRVLRGLPSAAVKDVGSGASGPSDVAEDRGQLAVLIGLGADPAVRATLPAAGQRLGTLVRTTWRGGLRTVADLAAWERDNNPIENADSNPVGLLVDDGRYVVVDAGGNTVLSVRRSGRIRQLAAFEGRLVEFPPGSGQRIPMQAVPTSAATRGWDGAYYISELTGFPFPAGGANIYRLDPHTGNVTTYATGLTNVTDLAFHGRTLYAVQIAANGLLAGPVGSVVQVKPGGTTPAHHTTIAGNLPAPYGIAIHGHSAYVTTNSASKDVGQVVRIRL